MVSSIASPYVSASGFRCSGSRAVAATESPRFKAASVHWRPNPREVPVINHIFLTIIRKPSFPLLDVFRQPPPPPSKPLSPPPPLISTTPQLPPHRSTPPPP